MCMYIDLNNGCLICRLKATTTHPTSAGLRDPHLLAPPVPHTNPQRALQLMREASFEGCRACVTAASLSLIRSLR